MKKILPSVFITASIFILMPYKVYALDISVGAAAMYAWWEMDLKKDSATSESHERNIDPAFLYGPTLSIKFNRNFNLTFVYLYGKFDFKDSFNSISDMYGTKKRSDGDLALNYRLNDYFKAFAGIKHMACKYEMTKLKTGVPGVEYNSHIEHSGFGPGAGLSCTVPVAENLFILATLSGFYLWGDHKEKTFLVAPSTKENRKFDYTEYGINSNLSVAYYITPASTAISLGGRFQYFKTVFDKPAGLLDRTNNYNTKSKFYGVTLAATYTFSTRID